MAGITPEMARREMARRELERRQQSMQQEELQLPPEESFFSKLPRNILIGLTSAGRNLHNLPHDLMQAIEGRGQEFNQSLNISPQSPMSNPLSSHLPHDITDYAEVFGQEGRGTLMDDLLQKGIEYAPELIGAGGLLRAGLRRYPMTKGFGARRLRNAETMMQEAGSPDIPMSNQLIDQMKPFLPKTLATQKMLEGAEAGEYAPKFAVQSQLGQHERNLAKSPLASERLMSIEARELKQRALDEFETGLRAHGYNDIADELKGGLTDYAKYVKFREKVLPIIKKIGIPTSLLALVGVGTTKGKQALKNLTS